MSRSPEWQAHRTLPSNLMTARPRMTVHVQAVLRLLLSDPTAEHFGLEIAKSAGMMPGTAYPILARLVRLGWLETRWENVDPRAAGRPRRRFYRLTETGVLAARPALAKAGSSRPLG
ncbi:PadR family transcriptional regulator [Lentzea chajnantorensis]